MLVASEAGLKKCGRSPIARIVAHATAGGPPRELFFTPPVAVKMVCEKAGWNVGDVDVFELNEAFASQTLAGLKALELDVSNVNVNGGAIALGHPIGASGARVLVTLLHVMKQRNARVASRLCAWEAEMPSPWRLKWSSILEYADGVAPQALPRRFFDLVQVFGLSR